MYQDGTDQLQRGYKYVTNNLKLTAILTRFQHWSVSWAQWIQATSALFHEDLSIAHLSFFHFPTFLSTFPSFLKTKNKAMKLHFTLCMFESASVPYHLPNISIFYQFMGSCWGKVILQDKSLQSILISGREYSIFYYNAFVMLRRKYY